MLQEAQEANIKAVHRQELQDRRSLSVAMLMQGRPHAFVDFFMLSQSQYGSAPAAENSAAAAAANEAAAGGMGSSSELSLQSVILLQQQLVVADAVSKAGQHEQAFAAHAHMARHFTQLGMLDKSVFFWKKCLQVRQHESTQQSSTRSPVEHGQHALLLSYIMPSKPSQRNNALTVCL
jgi:hypothetical protein